MTVEELKKLLTFYPEMQIPLQDANTITEVMAVIQRHSSFTTYCYLEDLVDVFNIAEAKEEIAVYRNFVEHFCQHTLTQHSYVASLLADKSRCLLSAKTIIFKLEWGLGDKKTLADIKSILNKTFEILANHIHVKEVQSGCVMVTCYAPQYLMGALLRLAQENKEMLVESGVSYLSVGYAVLLDNSAQKVKTVL